jgi:hypothetical protein
MYYASYLQQQACTAAAPPTHSWHGCYMLVIECLPAVHGLRSAAIPTDKLAALAGFQDKPEALMLPLLVAVRLTHSRGRPFVCH